LISAEIPDKDEDLELYEIVIRRMIHGPCGELNPNSSCMFDGKCSKGYPKDYEPHTRENVDGYPRYRRRCDGRSFKVRNIALDNRWVVPYNKYLLKKYNIIC
jgi:hypothetical protein